MYPVICARGSSHGSDGTASSFRSGFGVEGSGFRVWGFMDLGIGGLGFRV